MVVTGGTGALGTAVVGRLLDAGAVCHLIYLAEQVKTDGIVVNAVVASIMDTPAK
jgi:nucleoside-diphosphate-sugar epimerase